MLPGKWLTSAPAVVNGYRALFATVFVALLVVGAPSWWTLGAVGGLFLISLIPTHTPKWLKVWWISLFAYSLAILAAGSGAGLWLADDQIPIHHAWLVPLCGLTSVGVSTWIQSKESSPPHLPPLAEQIWPVYLCRGSYVVAVIAVAALSGLGWPLYLTGGFLVVSLIPVSLHPIRWKMTLPLWRHALQTYSMFTLIAFMSLLSLMPEGRAFWALAILMVVFFVTGVGISIWEMVLKLAQAQAVRAAMPRPMPGYPPMARVSAPPVPPRQQIPPLPPPTLGTLPPEQVPYGPYYAWTAPQPPRDTRE